MNHQSNYYQSNELFVPSIYIPNDIDKEQIINLLDNFIVSGIDFLAEIQRRKIGSKSSNELLSLVGNRIITDLSHEWK